MTSYFRTLWNWTIHFKMYYFSYPNNFKQLQQIMSSSSATLIYNINLAEQSFPSF